MDDQGSVVVDLSCVEFNGDCGVVFNFGDGSSDLDLDSRSVNSDGFLHVNGKDVNLRFDFNINSCSLVRDNNYEPVIKICARFCIFNFDFKFILVNSGIVVI